MTKAEKGKRRKQKWGNKNEEEQRADRGKRKAVKKEWRAESGKRKANGEWRKRNAENGKRGKRKAGA